MPETEREMMKGFLFVLILALVIPIVFLEIQSHPNLP